jgi:hypothetical protein
MILSSPSVSSGICEMSMYLMAMLIYERRQICCVCGRSCLHPCALSGPYRPRGAHGFSPLLVHFSGKSACFGGKLSDRMSESFHRLGRSKASRGESKLCSCGAGGSLLIVATLQGMCMVTCALIMPASLRSSGPYRPRGAHGF